jgi:protein required for attachment to host cells
MSKTWVLVAESSRAKLYAAKGRSKPFNELEDFIHPEGRLHEGDLVSDSAGSDGGSVGQGRRVMNNKTEAREQQHIDFARELAQRLEKARNEGSFDNLVLIAPPAFLGLLRNNLSKEVMERVSEQFDKNLVRQSADEVRSYLYSAM